MSSKRKSREELAFRILAATLLVICAVLIYKVDEMGIVKKEVKIVPDQIEASLHFNTPKKIEKKEPPKPKPEPKKKKKKKVIKKTIKQPKVVEKVPEKVEKEEKPVAEKEVYGQRKIYSGSLGSGSGSGRNAIVTKKGNSLSVPVDTIKATEADLKGSVSSVAAISKMPKIKKAIKPEYTDDMRKNNIQGKIRARVLVDVDGIVKKIKILNDLGHGSKQASIAAIKKMKFDPARRGEEKVAVWIPLSFRFQLNG